MSGKERHDYSWIKPGVPVWYQSVEGELSYTYPAVIDEGPSLMGDTEVVALREMGSNLVTGESYREGRTHESCIACWAVFPRAAAYPHPLDCAEALAMICVDYDRDHIRCEDVVSLLQRTGCLKQDGTVVYPESDHRRMSINPFSPDGKWDHSKDGMGRQRDADD